MYHSSRGKKRLPAGIGKRQNFPSLRGFKIRSEMPMPPSMPRRLPLLLASAVLAALAAAPAAHADLPAFHAGEVVVKREGEPARTVAVPAGTSVREALADLRGEPGVESAAPSPIARIAGTWPNDPGATGVAGGWRQVQWNLDGPSSVQAMAAWINAQRAGAPGGRGSVVAVLDTGVAYRSVGPFVRSPDFTAADFVRGHDFVDDDRRPLDENGHGTHVAGTIAEGVDNGVGLTGLAYGAKIMPVRVLDEKGEGDVPEIARGVRYAARRGADVINLSLEFAPQVTAKDIPELLDAIGDARRAGTLVVGASGNQGHRAVAWPARSSNVVAVGATTERGCLSNYSNEGAGLDLVAPGGGRDADLADPGCTPGAPGRPIYQLTFAGSLSTFGYPDSYEGTSMAAPHVAAAAALVVATGAAGRDPSPAAIERHLERTARDLGAPGVDTRYGAGLLDAGAATATARRRR